MRIRTSFCVLVLMLTAAIPAQAAFCTDRDGDSIGVGFSFGGPFTDEERNDFDMMRLRQEGVDVTRVERWNGCIRAFVRKPEGGEEMQFFDPNSFQRVQ